MENIKLYGSHTYQTNFIVVYCESCDEETIRWVEHEEWRKIIENCKMHANWDTLISSTNAIQFQMAKATRAQYNNTVQTFCLKCKKNSKIKSWHAQSITSWSQPSFGAWKHFKLSIATWLGHGATRLHKFKILL